ncbi:MAG: Maf family protein [Geminicoccaceae bacterium]
MTLPEGSVKEEGNVHPSPLILASSSPRRLDLMRQVGIEPVRIESPDIDEAPLAHERPRDHALRLAVDKRDAVIERLGKAEAYVLAADTVVACGRRILPKAKDPDTAEHCLRLLSGRRHRVYTGVAVSSPDGRDNARVVMTMVTLKRLGSEQLMHYLQSEEWQGKAGGYGIQGRADAFVTAIQGSYSNVVGLPLQASTDLLRGLGFKGLP